MRELKAEPFEYEEALTEYVNVKGILQKDIVSINVAVNPTNGVCTFYLFYY